MDNSIYSGRIEEDSAVSFGRESNYSKLENMESMDMDAKLIQSSKQRFLARNCKLERGKSTTLLVLSFGPVEIAGRTAQPTLSSATHVTRVIMVSLLMPATRPS